MQDVVEDARDASFFKTTTFSKYKKSDVKRELLTSLVESQIEPSCYWSTEMICSGQFSDLWEIILFYFGKYIQAANPKMAVYLDLRFNIFKEVVQKEPVELDLRNKPLIRQLFAELMTVLCSSSKKLGIEIIKIRKDELDSIQGRLKAPTADFAKPFFKPGDPMEIYAAVNEVAYSLHAKNLMDSCFWLEWVMLYASLKKPPPRCVARSYVTGKKPSTEPIWILWDIFVAYAKPNPLYLKITTSTLRLFCLHYTPSANERRRHLLYFIASLLCDETKTDVDFVPDKKMIEVVSARCNVLYKDIRKHSIKLAA